MQGFFAVGVAEWRQACELGLNAAASFLVLACGTGRDNQTTAWSSNAVQQYAGISWVRAKPAIEQLEKAGLVQRADGSTTAKPRYKLTISDDRIWLPKNVVIPLTDETPVLTRLRQTQDVMTLRLFVELYHSQNLAADGGLSRSVYYQKFHKAKFCESGKISFLGFDPAHTYVAWDTPVTTVHRTKGPSDKQGEEFFKRIGTLHDLGLLERSVCLFESEHGEAEILFPVDGPTQDERAVHKMAEVVAESVLPPWRLEQNPHTYLIPVYRHQEQAALYSVYRLKLRPQTKLTGAWWATMQGKIGFALDQFTVFRG